MQTRKVNGESEGMNNVDIGHRTSDVWWSLKKTGPNNRRRLREINGHLRNHAQGIVLICKPHR